MRQRKRGFLAPWDTQSTFNDYRSHPGLPSFIGHPGKASPNKVVLDGEIQKNAVIVGRPGQANRSCQAKDDL